MTFVDFSGKTAIVTGGGSGIGRAAALQMAELGASIVIADLITERADESVSMITAAGGHAVASVGDLSEQSIVDQAVSLALDTYGSIDVLVANAGVGDDLDATIDITDAIWERFIRINLTATFLLTRAVLPHMVEKKSGSIVITSSEAGLRGSAAGTAYTVTKHGLIGLTRSTAVMYRDLGIRVNAIAPGATATKMVGDTDAILNGTPTQGLSVVGAYARNIGGTAQPNEVAAGIVFLASDAASHITGIVMPIDGGWSAV